MHFRLFLFHFGTSATHFVENRHFPCSEVQPLVKYTNQFRRYPTCHFLNHYTQKYVAKHLNVARSTIAGYETKNRQPSHEKLTILAELFHVSVDYLLDDDISEITLSNKSTAQKSEHYLLTHFHRLSNSSKKELLNFLQYLEQRDESTRNKSAL